MSFRFDFKTYVFVSLSLFSSLQKTNNIDEKKKKYFVHIDNIIFFFDLLIYFKF